MTTPNHASASAASLRNAPWRGFLAGLAAIALLGLAPAAAAQEAAAEAGFEDEVYQDWRVRCEEAGEDGPGRCFMFQNLVLREGNRQLLNLAIGFPQEDGPAVGILMLPLGIALPPGVQIQIDEGEPVRIQFEHCISAGCRAPFPLEEGLVESMKAGKQAKVTFYDASRRPVELPVSLAGFTAAYEALKDKPAAAPVSPAQATP